MKLNTVQVIYAAFLGVDRDFYDRETATVAVQQTREIVALDGAPHKNRGTPPRPRFPRAVRAPRLFKGHRI